MATIYKDFAQGLSELNGNIVSPDLMVKTKAGRAYKINDEPFVGSIHTEAVGEFHHRLSSRIGQNKDVFGSKVYAGAAGFTNLGYAAKTRAAAVILYDINVAQTVFWESFIKALAENPERKGFLKWLAEAATPLMEETLETLFNKKSFLVHSASKNERLFRSDISMEKWMRPKGRKDESPDRSWMFSDEEYIHLHRLARANAIGALTLDVCDQEACQELRNFLDNTEFTPIDADQFRKSFDKMQTGSKINLLYISNIFRFLSAGTMNVQPDWPKRLLAQNTQETAVQNLSTLLNPNECFVIDGEADRHSRDFALHAPSLRVMNL